MSASLLLLTAPATAINILTGLSTRTRCQLSLLDTLIDGTVNECQSLRSLMKKSWIYQRLCAWVLMGIIIKKDLGQNLHVFNTE